MFRSLSLILAGLVLALAVAPTSGPAFAKEYNKRQHLAPAQRAKVDRTVAKSRFISTQQGPGGAPGAPGDVTNTGCGQLEIGTIEPDPRSRRRQPSADVNAAAGAAASSQSQCGAPNSMPELSAPRELGSGTLKGFDTRAQGKRRVATRHPGSADRVGSEP